MRRLVSIILILAVTASVEASTVERTDALNRRTVVLLADLRMAEARHEFRRLSEIDDRKSRLQQGREAYGNAVASASSDADMGVSRLSSYLKLNPHSIHAPELRFRLAMAYCAHEQFSLSDSEFAQVSLGQVRKSDRDEYYMKYGYTKFMLSDYTTARTLMSNVSPTGKYHSHAVYYMSYMDYAEGKLDEAYRGFSSLSKDESYGDLMPYYLLQIEFSRSHYDYVVKEGTRLLSSTAQEKRKDIYRLLAESWFRLADYRQAMLSMQSYVSSGGEMGRGENYILGYSSYRVTDYSTAAEALKKVSSGDDSMAQNAAYHLADCLLHLNDVRGAIAAFSLAASLKFDPEIGEDALYNYGKLLFDSNGGSFNQAINVLARYISTYPSSSRAETARKLLVAAYYNSADYDLAYDAIMHVGQPDASIKAARQKILLYRGVGALRDNDLDKAEKLLRESSSVGVSPKFNALSAYFMADVDYRRGNYEASAKDYAFFLRRSPRMTYEYMMACYGQGYAYLKSGDSRLSATAFELFIKSYKAPDAFRADAMCRMGDALFLGRNYRDAMSRYDNASALGITPYADYGSFQAAQMAGLLNRMGDKERRLRSIVSAGKGEYVDDAHFELGRMLMSQARYTDAAAALESFVGTHTESEFFYPALLNLGLAYLNSGDSDKSMECYDRIVRSNPHSTVAKSAMQNIREIYVSRGDVESFFAYAEKSDVECNLNRMTRDSLSFRVAQNMYEQGRMEQAAEKLDAYLTQYERGYYRTDALFLQADAYIQLGRKAEAMRPLGEVTAMQQNQYTIPSYERLADVAMQLKSYEESSLAYRRLYDLYPQAEAKERAAECYMEAAVATEDTDRMLAVAEDLDTLNHVSVSVRRRSAFTKARILASREDAEASMSIFRTLAENPMDREGAESSFRVIADLYAKGEKEECEKLIYRLADSGTTHNYWLGRSFILLGDIYAERGDAFQARATYQSIVDGYTPADDGVVDEARDRISRLK